MPKSPHNQFRSYSPSSSEYQVVPLTESTRAIKRDTVAATELMKELDDEEVLKRDCYFGRYGKVTKVVISSRHPAFKARNEHIQVFVTYEDNRDAAFAIVALDQLKHHKNMSVKAHYGSSKYCSAFLKDRRCYSQECRLLHQESDWNVEFDELKDSIPKQFKVAHEVMAQDIEYFLEKQYKEYNNSKKKTNFVQCQCYDNTQNVTLPTIKDTMEQLIKQGIIDKKVYDLKKSQFKQKQKAYLANVREKFKKPNDTDKKKEVKGQKIPHAKPKQQSPEVTAVGQHSKSISPMKLSSDEFPQMVTDNIKQEGPSAAKSMPEPTQRDCIGIRSSSLTIQEEKPKKKRRKYVRKQVQNEEEESHSAQQLLCWPKGMQVSPNFAPDSTINYQVATKLKQKMNTCSRISPMQFTWGFVRQMDPFESVMEKERRRTELRLQVLVAGAYY